ncbi:MAG: hypothetical protein ACE5KU_04290 [Nitrososphaerales archaeon]
MRAGERYEVRVRVKTLSEASKVIQTLDELGYRDVEMSLPRGPWPTGMFAKIAETVRGRLNKMILRALYRLGASDKEHGVEVDKIVEEMRNDPESGGLVQCSPEGILTRTVAMIAPAILAEKHRWVSYGPEQTPRRFWLTEKGIKEAKVKMKRINW